MPAPSHRSPLAAAAFALVAALAIPGGAGAQTDAYLDHDGLTRALRSVTNGSDVARITSAGRSMEGRDVWVVELANRSGAPVDGRPALLVVGNLEGDHLLGSHLALETVRHIVSNAGDPEVKRILDEQVIYVFPRLNPDGAEAMFGAVRWARRGNARPVDDDNDGRTDEDGAEDLDGNGVITVMRVPDPAGDYMIDPAEPRLMKKADPAKGESGAYTLHLEGRDRDGDGFIAEDGAGGVDLNRNFQHAYPYYQADAGLSMVSEPESRALMDFLTAHRNVAAILTYGHSDNLVTPPDSRGELASARTLDLTAFAAAANADVHDVGMVSVGGGRGGGGFGFGFFGGGPRLRGAQPGRDNDPSSGRRPSTTVDRADQEYHKTVSDAYREITGIETVGVTRAPEGAFFQFGYFQFGVPSFSTPGWGLPAPEGADDAPTPGDQGAAASNAADDPAAGARPGAGRGAAGPGGRPGGGPQQARGAAAGGGGVDATVLKALEGAGIDAFVPWSSFQHPDLGPVEIGGFRPYATTNPPPAQLGELGEKHGRFAVRLAGMLPRVRIVDAKVTAHGGGIYTVEVEVENGGYLPTSLQHGVASRSVHPTTVQIQVATEDLVTGDDKSARIQKLDGSKQRERFLWVIRGRDGQTVEITTRAQKGGTDSHTVTLGR